MVSTPFYLILWLGLIIMGGAANFGDTGFWYATPACMAAGLILFSKEESKLKKIVILISIFCAFLIWGLKSYESPFIYPLNQKTLIVKKDLCMSAMDAKDDKSYYFESYKSEKECQQSSKILKKDEKVQVVKTSQSTYFLSVTQFIHISTKHGIGLRSEFKPGQIKTDDFTFEGEDLDNLGFVNEFIVFLAALRFFPFGFIAPAIYFYLSFRGKSTNRKPSL